MTLVGIEVEMRKRVYSKPAIEISNHEYRNAIKRTKPILADNSGFRTCYSTNITARQRTADRPKAEGGERENS